jgi:hypothetical protein
MGALLRPHFDRKVPRTGFEDEGKFLLAEMAGLDELAEHHGAALLSSFFDERELRAWRKDTLEESDEEFDQSFRAADGATAVRQVLNALRETNDWAGSEYERPELLDALDSLHEQLKIAAKLDARFRFEIVP